MSSRFVFSASSTGGRELWIDDGRALFDADDGTHGVEPWATDGTPEGTYLVADINPGPSSSFPGEFSSCGNEQALFVADDGVHGREIWVTDGTPEGTRLLADLNPGAGSSDPSGFAQVSLSTPATTLGDDIIIGTEAPDFLFGDTSGALSDTACGGNDLIFGLGNIDTLFGDSSSLSCDAQGGNDIIFGGTDSDNLYGDAGQMFDNAQGGDDLLSGGEGSDSMRGDGVSMVGHTRGGNDLLSGDAGDDFLSGDADVMWDEAQGGNDGLSGGEGSDHLFGDAGQMLNNARGGDDRLSGGEGNDLLFGDSREISGNAQGGHDAFVFDGTFGDDTVGDFRQGEDILEFNVPGVNGIEDLQIALVGSDTVITAGTAGTVTLVGFTSVLTDVDLLFVTPQVSSRVIEAHGSTQLDQVGTHFFLDDSTGSGPSLKVAGVDFVAGQYGDWAPISAEKTAGGYEVAWKNGAVDQYVVWTTDANGTYTGHALPGTSGSDPLLQQFEPSFAHDLNGDGQIGDYLAFGPDAGTNWDVLVPGPGGSLIPTYGEFGGPGYTGGQVLPASSPSPPEAYQVPPIDPLDALFKQHDVAYDPGLTPNDPLIRAQADLALLQGIWEIPSSQMDADAIAYGGLAMLLAIGQIEFVHGHPELLPQEDLLHYTEEALQDVGRGLTTMPAQEAQSFEQLLGPLGNLSAGPELAETVLNTLSHLFPHGPTDLLA